MFENIIMGLSSSGLVLDSNLNAWSVSSTSAPSHAESSYPFAKLPSRSSKMLPPENGILNTSRLEFKDLIIR